MLRQLRGWMPLLMLPVAQGFAAAAADPVYPAGFYQPFQPQNALDMLVRTPGFQISGGNDLRGFGAAAGNVLIDGQRPAVKSDLGELLRRIPAARVAHIKLIRAAQAAEAQGQLIADVVLEPEETGAGQISLALVRTPDERVSPAGRLGYTTVLGAWQTSMELLAEVTRHASDAVHRMRDADDRLVDSGVEEERGTSPEYGFGASGSRPLADGTLTLNLYANHDVYEGTRIIGMRDGASGPATTQRRISHDERSSSGELGAGWSRSFADWTATWVGLGRTARFTLAEEYEEPEHHGLSSLHHAPLEAVVRASFARTARARMQPEFGIEVAYNRLASSLDYTEMTAAGPVPVVLDNAHVRVAELRGEAFASITTSLSSVLQLEAGSAFELSRIRVTADDAQSQRLAYLKPHAALVWTASESTQLRAGLRRSVDQLDFGDFAASVDQASQRPLGGNSQLRPARITRALLRLDHRWPGGGAVATEAWQEWQHGRLGYFLLPSGDEALGAVGKARTWGLETTATLPLEAVLPDATLMLHGRLQDMRLRDPLTGWNLRSAMPSRTLSVEFRHDIPALRASWGISHETAVKEQFHYTRELLTERQEVDWKVFIESTTPGGLKIRLGARAIGGRKGYALRRFYSPDRAGVLVGTEERRYRDGAVFSLTLSRPFRDAAD